MKHALEAYSKDLDDSNDYKGLEFERDAVQCVIDRMDGVSHAPGM